MKETNPFTQHETMSRSSILCCCILMISMHYTIVVAEFLCKLVANHPIWALQSAIVPYKVFSHALVGDCSFV